MYNFVWNLGCIIKEFDSNNFLKIPAQPMFCLAIFVLKRFESECL